MKPIVEIKGLYKQYRSGDRIEYLSLRESITDFFKKSSVKKKNLFYALENINFEIKPGESVGVLGKNGAGKSTLLKVLSKITYPTRGEITMRARIASLLEVGTGFHSELTGRENIYFNGTILGMKKQEIDACFDSIVDFSGVEQFLDTPLKRYSSGMAVRLGFAVAAHLEPELMIVDEVLAVGDVEFQKKCILKMNDVVREGRTVLFVSHNMQMLEKLCARGIYMDKGKVVADDTIEQAVSKYLSENIGYQSTDFFQTHEPTGNFAFTNVEVFDSENRSIQKIKCGHPFKMRIHYSSQDPKLGCFSFKIIFSDQRMRDVLYFTSESLVEFTISVATQSYFDIEVKKTPLVPGTYFLSFYAKSQSVQLEYLDRVFPIEVVFDDYYGSGLLPPDGYLSDYTIKY